MRLHRGRMIDHLQLVVKDLAASKRFYAGALGALGIPLGGEGEDYFWYEELFVSSRESAAAQGVLTGRTHLAFQAESREAVDRFYRAALAAGGRDNGAPGERPYHPGLCRVRSRPGRQQHRGRRSRPGTALGRVGGDHVRALSHMTVRYRDHRH
jgi:catechol 2,3-dioxygenase-like lactoylglutathione lyase family enzyme